MVDVKFFLWICVLEGDKVVVFDDVFLVFMMLFLEEVLKNGERLICYKIFMEDDLVDGVIFRGCNDYR